MLRQSLEWLKNPWVSMLAMLAGLLTGIAFPSLALHLKVLGDLLIRLLSLVTIPIIVFLIITSMAQMLRSGSVQRYAMRTLIVFVVGALMSASLAIFIYLVADLIFPLRPETYSFLGRVLESPQFHQASTGNAVGTLMESIVPENVFFAFSSGQLLAMCLVSMLIGIALGLLPGNGGDRLQQIFESLNEVFLIILDWVLYFLPIGLFGLLASAAATVGSEVLAAMGLVIGVNYLTMTILCLIYLVTIRIALSVTWKSVMAALRTPMMISFVTMDPFPAIPLAIENMAKYLKISRVVPGYSIPVTISLNGHNLTVQLAIVAVFLAQIYGIHLTVWDYLFVILCTAYPGSLAGPSLPTLLLMVPYVLGPLHLPVEPGVAVILISGPLLAPIAGIHTFLSGCANAAIIAISGPRELSVSNKA